MNESRRGPRTPDDLDRPVERDGRILGVVAAPRLDTPEATEFLRVLAAFRALEVPVSLVEAGSGVGTLSAECELELDAERYFTALRDDDVHVLGPLALAQALAAASAVLVLGDPGRRGDPPVFEVDRGRVLARDEVAALLAAGQVRIV